MLDSSLYGVRINPLAVSQNIEGTAFVTSAQVAFVNNLVRRLLAKAPELDPVTVIATGATILRDVLPTLSIDGSFPLIWMGFGIQVVLGVAIGATGVAFLVSLGGKWEEAKPVEDKEGTYA